MKASTAWRTLRAKPGGVRKQFKRLQQPAVDTPHSVLTPIPTKNGDFPKRRVSDARIEVQREPDRGDILLEAEAGMVVAEVARKHSISAATFYQWRSKYGGMSVSDNAARAGTGKRAPQANVRGSEPGSHGAEGSADKKFLTPIQRREAVAWAMNDKQLSQRRACRLMARPRGTQRRILQGRREDGVADRDWLNWRMSMVPGVALSCINSFGEKVMASTTRGLSSISQARSVPALSTKAPSA